jgi:hypothetical protein
VFLLWFAFMFLPQAVHSMFEQRPWRLLLINTGVEFCNLLVISAIIGHFG